MINLQYTRLEDISEDTVFAKGHPVIVDDSPGSIKLIVGDGSTKFSNLPYVELSTRTPVLCPAVPFDNAGDETYVPTITNDNVHQYEWSSSPKFTDVNSDTLQVAGVNHTITELQYDGLMSRINNI